MSKNSSKILGFVGVLALLSVNTAMAGEALSWNLSRDMMTSIKKNPSGAWSFMQNSSDLHNPANYTLFPNHSTTCNGSFPLNCWRNTTDGIFGYIGIPTKNYTWASGGKTLTATKGVVHTHPGPNGNAPVLRWKSPIAGTISILGRVSDVDNTCGDGVLWSLESDTTVIDSGAVNGDGAVFSAQNLHVSKGASVYFIIDMGADWRCDTTNLDMVITSQQ